MRERLVILMLLILGGCLFAGGISWGLPSRGGDAILFGSAGAPTGAQVRTSLGDGELLTGTASDQPSKRSSALAADEPVNRTDSGRAELAVRFRLYSHNPDEMLTFRALAAMKAGRGDPRMYYYGGLWVYPVGAGLKAASLVGAVQLRGDLDFYLDRPEEFARFYIVARLYSVAWGLVGIGVVYALGKRLFGGIILPTAAALCFMLMPVVINAAHEAKPHLASAVLVLLAVLAAGDFARTGRRRGWILAGVWAGASGAMALSGLVAMVIPIVMVFLRPMPGIRRLRVAAGALGAAALVFALTNPFLVYNLLANRAVVGANIGNLLSSRTFAGQTAEKGPAPLTTIASTADLIAEGMSLPLALAAMSGGILLGWRRGIRKRSAAIPSNDAGNYIFPLAIVAGLMLLQFAVNAAHQPGEFGRFALLPDIAMLFLAVVVIQTLTLRSSHRIIATFALAALVAVHGLSYLMGFADDAYAAGRRSSRYQAAVQIDQIPRLADRLVIRAVPAPYNCPPVNLKRWKITVLGVDAPLPSPLPDVIVQYVDRPNRQGVPTGYVRTTHTAPSPWFANRISWAGKPIEVLVRRDLLLP